MKRQRTKTRGVWLSRRRDGTVIYGITYTTAEGVTVRKVVGPKKALADEALNAVRTDIARGAYHLAPIIQSPTFRAFAKKYIEHAPTEKRSWRLDRECLKPLTAHFGHRHLGNISSFHIEQYKQKRVQEVSPRTVNIELSILSRMFRLARNWKLMSTDPMASVSRLKEREKVIRVVSPAEEMRLLDAAPEHLRDFIILALNTGLRLGELRHLAGGDVNLGVGALTVRQSKTDRVRHVPLNKNAIEIVRKGLKAGHPTILHYQGRPLGNIHRTWYKATKKAGLSGLRIHDLRHTFATRLVLGGADLATVASLLGHSSIVMTQRYAHPSPASKRLAVGILSASLLPPRSRAKR